MAIRYLRNPVLNWINNFDNISWINDKRTETVLSSSGTILFPFPGRTINLRAQPGSLINYCQMQVEMLNGVVLATFNFLLGAEFLITIIELTLSVCGQSIRSPQQCLLSSRSLTTTWIRLLLSYEAKPQTFQYTKLYHVSLGWSLSNSPINVYVSNETILT